MTSVQVRLMAAAMLVAGIGAGTAVPAASADEVPWLARCSRELADQRDAENARYGFKTRGKEEGAPARAEMSFNATGYPTQTVYLTDFKEFMSRYSGASLGIAWYGDVANTPPHGMNATIGRVSVNTTSRDFKPIPGKVAIKLLIDGKVFGPYEPKASSVSGGMYTVWLDTADTDGDSSPPVLKPKQFAELTKAVDRMKTAEVVIVQDGKDIARQPVPLTKYAAWRDGLPQWAAETRARFKGAMTVCRYDENMVN